MQAVYAGAAIGAVSGATLGGYSASQQGGDISRGVLFGAAVGSVTGAAQGYIGSLGPGFSWENLGQWYLPKAGAGIVSNFGSGLINGYGGGTGKIGNILIGATSNAGFGMVTSPLYDGLVGGAFGSFDRGQSSSLVIDLSGNVVEGPTPWAGFREIAQGIKAMDQHPASLILRDSTAQTLGEVIPDLILSR